MRLFGKQDPEGRGLEELEEGAEEFRKGVAAEEAKLKELFLALKTDVIDEIERGSLRDRRSHLSILEEQVRHVISVARAIGYKRLIRSFEEEEKMVEQLKDLVDEFPDTSARNPRIRECLDSLRGLMADQQDMIFSHSQILSEEKQRVVAILQQVEALKKDRFEDQHLDEHRERSQDTPAQYL